MKPKIIWKSEIFENMVFTDQMLDVYKRAYPNIKSFRDELLKGEAWLISNPERVPKKHFGKFINNWMRIANEIVINKQNSRFATPSANMGNPTYRYANETPGLYRSGSNNKDAKSLSNILQNIKDHT